jgi:hypothetical protein
MGYVVIIRTDELALGHEVVSGYSQHQGQHLLQFAVNFLVNF